MNDDNDLWKPLYKLNGKANVEKFKMWFDPIERYIIRKLEEPKIEEK